MNKILEESLLYDFYGELLTKRQQEIYENVRFGDLSLSEAAEEYGISRQGIHDMIRRSEAALADYEAKLGLVAKFMATREKAAAIRRLCEELEKECGSKTVNDIKQLTKEIEEL